MSDNFKHKRSKWTCFTTLLWLIFWKLPKKCLLFQCEGCENRNSFEYNKVSFYWFFADYYIRTFFLRNTDKNIIMYLRQKKQQNLVKDKRVWVHQWSPARQITHSFSTHRFYTVESFCRAKNPRAMGFFKHMTYFISPWKNQWKELCVLKYVKNSSRWK